MASWTEKKKKKEEIQDGLGNKYVEVTIWLNLSNIPCEAWNMVHTFIFHVKKLVLRRIPSL